MHEYVGYLMRRAYTRFTAEALDDGPRSRDVVVLDVLANDPATSQQELAERLGINRTIMVRLVDRLEAAGYVTRTRNPANRRSYLLSITDAGRKALDDMREVVLDRDARVTAGLTADERNRLDALLGRLLPEPGVHSTGYLVAQAYHRLRRQGDALVAEHGLRMRHVGPLTAIDRHGPCPQLRLAHELGITEPAAAELVDDLVQAGLVARGRDPHDRRRYALELTDLGRQRLGVLRQAARRLTDGVRQVLGTEGDAELRALLTKLVGDWRP